MKKMLLVLLLGVSLCFGSTFDDGFKAYDNGNYKKAFELFMKSENHGNVRVQTVLGLMHANGLGVKQDYTKAFEWYSKSANQGVAEAQYNLGFMYANGKGVRQDKKIAKDWAGKACDNGLQVGCDVYKTFNEAEY